MNNLEAIRQEEGTYVSADSIHTENLSIGGDINQHYYNGKDRFTSVQFDKYDDEYLSPTYLGDLIQIIREKRIVLISDDKMIAKSDLARHLSKELIKNDQFKNMPVVEMLREGDGQENRVSIIDVLEEEKCYQKVILLYDLHPEKIDYHFDRLIKQALSQSCIIIITVSGDLDTWLKAGKAVKDFWFSVPAGRHYTEEQLLNFFVLKLKQNPPLFLQDTVFENDFLLSPKNTVSEVINRFDSIDQVQLFVSYYSGLAELPGDYRLNEQIKALCQGHDQMVRSWFYQLDHKNKIIAISATLFDGMLIDQFLEALNTITDSSFWTTSEPSLKAIDYFNLSFLDSFFFIQTKDNAQYLISKSLSSKSVLMELGKLEYRRHFKTAFHQFSEMTALSYSTKPLNWDLYGTSVKRVWIRKSFTEALRITGTLEFDLVENHLLELAATGQSYLQNICAKAMAQWRLTGHDELFFTTLKNWQEDNSIEKRIQELFARNTEETSTSNIKAIDLIKATAVLALGQASYYDQPNKLHEDIVQGMVHFAKDSVNKKNVSDNIAKALPKFIHHHSLQLEHIIFDELMPISYLREPIINGLLQAFESYPKQVPEAMQRWFSSCIEDSSQLNRRSMTTYRDNKLIIILEILERADLSKVEVFSDARLYIDFLIPLIHQEKRIEVVTHVLRLLAKIQANDYELAARFAKETIGQLNKQQRLFLVECWGKTYSEQRLEMEESDTYVRNEQTYSVWMASKSRPLTSVERTLYKWMEGDIVKRRFATLTFLEIMRGYDQFERNEKLQRKVEQERILKQEEQVLNSAIRTIPPAPSDINLRLLLRIRIFIYFLFSSNENKFILKDTLLLFLNVNRYNSSDLIMLIQRWKNSEQKGLTTKLAKWLNKFF